MAELETKSTSIATKIAQAVTNSFRISSPNKKGINIFDSPVVTLSAPKIAYHMKTKVKAEISANSGWILLRKLAFTSHKKYFNCRFSVSDFSLTYKI